MAKKFLHVKQGELLRWEYKNIQQNQYGLYTDGFYNCTIILLRNNSNGRIAMLHADTTVTLAEIKREMQWVGDNCEKVIYYKDVPADMQTLDDIFGKDDLKKSFKLIKINKQYRHGKIIVDQTIPRLPDGSYIPEYEVDTILLDKEQIITTKQFIQGYNFINDQESIKHVYCKLQNTDADIVPKQGSNRENLESITLDPQILSYAVLASDESKLMNLLKIGLNIDYLLDENGITMLGLAAIAGKTDIVELLLKYNPSVNIQSKSDHATPLFFAAEAGHPAVVEQLLAAGADPSITNINGQRPYDIAKLKGHFSICQILLSHPNSNLATKLVHKTTLSTINNENNTHDHWHDNVVATITDQNKLDRLQNKTSTFFKMPIEAKWKKYPESSLTGQYVGHQVLFFTMTTNQAAQAEAFTVHLQQEGFNAALKKAKDKPSIVVDLTNSKLVYK